MTERIAIGLVGAGGIARARHVPGFRALPGVEIVGVVNRTPDSTARAAAELAIPRAYAGWEALVGDPDVNAVVVATWPYLHAPIAIAALGAGKHVLVEARMAMDGAEARAMLAAAAGRPDRVAMVVPAPFGFADATIRRLLAAGALGELRAVRVSWSGGIAPTGRDQWRRERRHSGNNVMTLGILYESVARWLGHATEVSASLRTFAATQAGPDGTQIAADVPDVAAVIAGFPGGVVATFAVAGYGRPDPVNRRRSSAPPASCASTWPAPALSWHPPGRRPSRRCRSPTRSAGPGAWRPTSSGPSATASRSGSPTSRPGCATWSSPTPSTRPTGPGGG
jgi:predicted dehydrogenase